MATNQDVLFSTYNEKVKVSSWAFVNESYPYDNSLSVNKGASHYKSFGPTNDVYIPKTTAKEAMESGTQKLIRHQRGVRALINFTSFPIADAIIVDDVKFKTMTKKLNCLTTYQKDFTVELNKSNELCNKLSVPHPLLNRLPKNEFLMVNPCAPDKFMDTHFFDIPHNRKCINYLRQIRNVSNIF